MTVPDQAQTQPEAPSPFVASMPLVQWAFDSTSLGTAMTCLRKYYYSQVRGLRRKRNAATLDFGSAFHKGLETFALELGKGTPPAQATEIALTTASALAVGMQEHKSRTPESLARSLQAYIGHHASEQMETITTAEGKPAVELHFKIELPKGTIAFLPEQGVLLCGYLDRVVRFQGTPYVLDSKTTGMSISTEKGSASYFGAFTPDNQISCYSWAAREAYGFPVRGVIIDAMQVAKTKTEFARQVIHRTPAQLDEWKDSAIYHIRVAATAGMVASQSKPGPDQARAYPMNTKACHSKFGPCTFVGICGRDPGVREAFLETEYAVEQWNPLAERNAVGTLTADSGETTEDD